MKVETINEVLDPVRSAALRKGEQTQNNRFGEILKETMETVSSPTSTGQAPSLVKPIGGICFDPSSLSTTTPVLEQTERLLDTLDAYRQKLGDREVGLSEMDPLINEIKKQYEGLTSKADALPDGDPLREILNQTLIVSSLEVLKFSRGDYSAT
ncbi:MAG: hypothetical protein K9N21_09665 [Deltaproteobacteria bacterium]|nr:hypothetical protein [Deltaproteobacteria bacterium]